jgi:hypothetical protein
MELSLGHFGDRRLALCGADLLGRLMRCSACGVSARRLGGDRAGEVRYGRFLGNPRVTPEEMVATAAGRTLLLARGRQVLVIQDTTSLRDDGENHSLNMHTAIVVDAYDGSLIGLLHAECLRYAGGKRDSCGRRPFEEKASFRWLAVARTATSLLEAGAARVTIVADQECDIYDVFAYCPAGIDVLVRAHHDRGLANGGTLHGCMRGVPALGRERITLPAAPGRAARDAVLTLRARTVRLLRPVRNRMAETRKLPPEVALTVVEALETRPPPGMEPVHWRLLTTRSVTTLAEARETTRHYRLRWTVEQVFRTMKTEGFRIEQARTSEGGPFENLATATLIAAVSVMQLVQARDGAAGRPLSDVFEPEERAALERLCPTQEGKTARQQNPHRRGTLAYGAWVCARLGGWTGYYGDPGPIVMFRGLQRFRQLQSDAMLLRALSPPAKRTLPRRGKTQCRA